MLTHLGRKEGYELSSRRPEASDRAIEAAGGKVTVFWSIHLDRAANGRRPAIRDLRHGLSGENIRQS